MTDRKPRVLRLHTIELLSAGAPVDPTTMLDAKRNGIDCWVHEVRWDDDKGRRQALANARSTSRPDFRFSVCVVLTANAVPTPQRVDDVIGVLNDANCLSTHARPTLFVRDEAGSSDLTGFIRPIRHAARAAGMREPRICRVTSAGELAGTRYVPGFDEIIELGPECRCHRPPSDARPAEVVTDGCLIAQSPNGHELRVASTIESRIDKAIHQDAQQAAVFVHACNGWSPELRRAHNRGLLAGMEQMPSFPRAAAPYESVIAYHEDAKDRPALSVAMVVQSNAEATMNCLQSALDNSSELGELEFVVIDNGSTDDTAALLEALGDNVRSVRNQAPVAVKNAWQQALEMTRGELVLMISSDVALGLNWHEPLVRALANDRSCNAVSPAIAVGSNHMPTQPPAVNSGVCILARGNAARRDMVTDARFVDESIVFQRLEAPERTQ